MTGPEAIAAAERLLKEITPGAWRCVRHVQRCVEGRAFDGSWRMICQTIHGQTSAQAEGNADFIAAAPELVATLRAALLQSQEALKQRQELIEVIYTTTRTDEKSECWTIRKYLDARNIFNDDIAGSERLIEIACAALLSPPVAPKEP